MDFGIKIKSCMELTKSSDVFKKYFYKVLMVRSLFKIILKTVTEKKM